MTTGATSEAGSTYLFLTQRPAGHTIGNPVFARLAVLAFDALASELLGLGFEFSIEEIDKLGLGVLCRIPDVVVG